MPQTFGMFNDLTIKENLSYLCALYDLGGERVSECLKTCCLEKEKDFLAGNLSGGYKQMLSLACAIIHRPKLLILDEPTVAMDLLFRERFWEIIRELNTAGCTILFITHYLEELKKCDCFACLSEGRIVYDGTLSEIAEETLKSKDSFFAHFFGGEGK